MPEADCIYRLRGNGRNARSFRIFRIFAPSIGPNPIKTHEIRPVIGRDLRIDNPNDEKRYRVAVYLALTAAFFLSLTAMNTVWELYGFNGLKSQIHRLADAMLLALPAWGLRKSGGSFRGSPS